MRLIDADFLKEWVDEYLSVFKKYDKGTIKGFVDHAPTIEPKRGEWIAVDSYSAFGGSEEQWNAHGNPIAYHYCSNCKNQTRVDEFGEEMLTDFCPSCGASMTEREGE